jgi:hypothetical protein
MRIDRNDLLNDTGVVVDVIKKQSKIPISIVQPEEGCIAVLGCGLGVIACAA